MNNIKNREIETERLVLKIPTMGEQKQLWNIVKNEEVNKYYFPTPDRIFNKYNLSKEKKKEYSSIKNSVDLGVGIADLCLLANDINEKINSFDDVKQKQELIELLSGIKENLLKMQLISNEYDQEIINDNEFITETLLENEKNEYVKRRENYKNYIL